MLGRLGHTCFVLSGNFKDDVVPRGLGTRFRPLSFFSPECEWEQNHAFFYPEDDPDELLTTVHEHARAVAIEIFRWVLANRIEVLLSENASALPCHLSMGLGIKLAAERLSLPVVTHDHDFAWERGNRYDTPFPEVEELVADTFPLQLPNVKHAVINDAARKELETRYGIGAAVVPNVMDFEAEYARRDGYNDDLLSSIGMGNGELPIFQVTRIVKRKGIETAIELVHKLDDCRIRLVVTGSAADDQRKGYFKELIEMIESRRLRDRVTFAHQKILSKREQLSDGRKFYSLEDAYAHSVAVTYFSTYEGFGNGFLEAVLARRPVFVNNYEPVYWPDIGSKGFDAVMLEGGVLTDEAVGQIDTILHDPERQREIAEHNFTLGRRHFSYDVLEEKLEALFDF
ncbi:MAG: glycosyltransferase family 4 protein [bacterium]|nr:glycosyltransferase family 4 protein [bacterium]